MTDNEMLTCLQSVWENMTADKDINTYKEILLLLDDMRYFLRYDLQIDYDFPSLDVPTGEFTF